MSKADNFLMLNPNIDSYIEVVYVALYLEEEGDHWYQTVQAEHYGLTWEFFIELLLKRFSTNNQEKLIGKFKKLTQPGSVDAYITQFEELRGFMMLRHSIHTEKFHLASFLTGLMAEIQQVLYIYKPATLDRKQSIRLVNKRFTLICWKRGSNHNPNGIILPRLGTQILLL